MINLLINLLGDEITNDCIVFIKNSKQFYLFFIILMLYQELNYVLNLVFFWEEKCTCRKPIKKKECHRKSYISLLHERRSNKLNRKSWLTVCFCFFPTCFFFIYRCARVTVNRGCFKTIKRMCIRVPRTIRNRNECRRYKIEMKLPTLIKFAAGVAASIDEQTQ